MYAKGMTTRDIESHVKEIYFGLEISPTAISSITDKILDHAKEWQSRPLNKLYPVVFFDAIHYKVRIEGKIICKAAYTCLGIDKNGLKDVLGIYIGENESSTFWLSVLTDLQNRGVQDILIACVDGLKGFPETIASIFPSDLYRPSNSQLTEVCWLKAPKRLYEGFETGLPSCYRGTGSKKPRCPFRQMGRKISRCRKLMEKQLVNAL